MYNILFCVSIHSREYLDCFQFGAIMDKAAINICLCISLLTQSSASLGVWFLNQPGSVWFISLKQNHCFLKVILDLCQFFVAMLLYLRWSPYKGKDLFSASFQSLSFALSDWMSCALDPSGVVLMSYLWLSPQPSFILYTYFQQLKLLCSLLFSSKVSLVRSWLQYRYLEGSLTLWQFSVAVLVT